MHSLCCWPGERDSADCFSFSLTHPRVRHRRGSSRRCVNLAPPVRPCCSGRRQRCPGLTWGSSWVSGTPCRRASSANHVYAAEMDCPSSSTCPLPGPRDKVVHPVECPEQEDLPHPDGPMMALMSSRRNPVRCPSGLEFSVEKAEVLCATDFGHGLRPEVGAGGRTVISLYHVSVYPLWTSAGEHTPEKGTGKSSVTASGTGLTRSRSPSLLTYLSGTCQTRSPPRVVAS